MARNISTPKVDNLDFSDDDDTEALFASPSRPQRPRRPKPGKPDTQEPIASQSRKLDNQEVDDEEAREAVLRKELARIRNINQVIEGAIDSLERAGNNMDTVGHTVNDASALLNTWTRILSQTEHSQRLILNPSWHGATQDMADVENESILRQQEKERRELEEAQKRESRARKAEEEERKRAEHAGTKTPRGGTGRGRMTSRGGSSRSTSYGASIAPAKDTNSKVARAGSGTGRGPGGYRGRSRGT